MHRGYTHQLLCYSTSHGLTHKEPLSKITISHEQNAKWNGASRASAAEGRVIGTLATLN